jgi:Xaa-Pro dipeptidase
MNQKSFWQPKIDQKNWAKKINSGYNEFIFQNLEMIMPTSINEHLFTNRQERLHEFMQDAGLDSMAFNAGPTLTYLTGLHFHLSERPVVAFFQPGEEPAIVLPELEAGKLKSLSFPVRSYAYGENPSKWGEIFKQAVNAHQLDGKKIGLEYRRFRVMELRLVEDAAKRMKLLSGEAVVARVRMQKDTSEISAMRKAVEIAQRALEKTIPSIQIGITERELASELTLQILRAGSDAEIPFSPIVASGPNSANPHAVPGGRTLEPGDLLIIDWGASYGGYISDITRTFSIGNIDPELEKIFNIVLEANEAGRSASQPGIKAGEIDQAARAVIESAGYGEYFTHRTGHGIGMEGHEEPYIYSGNELELQPGMTFTVEPGIYLPGRGGVRIEDDVLITEDSAESLTSLPREMITID